ncbi:MAG: cobalt-precorrin 5A hydrolase [Flexilinea sp.]|nr:cobalt-precorrin 5A hydrolase [Flexilinea sp.]
MSIAVFAFSRNGMGTASRLTRFLPGEGITLFSPERIASDPFSPIPVPSADFYGEHFRRDEALIFVGACGIAVRSVAPFIRSKQSDPAVLCIDEQGRFVIPILSGHIGGANRLAEKLAAGLGALTVVTTATDINGRFSVDEWAVRNGFIIDNMTRAKEISAAILEQDIALSSMMPLGSTLPNGLILKEEGPIGIFIGWEKNEPFGKTLQLIPKALHLGIGCRKGTDTETIRTAVTDVLTSYNIDHRALKCAASIDLKAGEPGLLEFCRTEGLPLSCYSAEELLAVPGEFAQSDFVESVTGVGNVCERAAMMHADRLVIPKTICQGVTVAAAAEMKEVCFE